MGEGEWEQLIVPDPTSSIACANDNNNECTLQNYHGLSLMPDIYV